MLREMPCEQTFYLSHCSSKGPFPSVAQAGVPLPRQNFPFNTGYPNPVSASHTVQPPAAPLYTQPGSPSVPVPLSPLCPKGFAWQENWLMLGMLHGEVMDSAPRHRALPLLAVARTNAQCHGPCMGRSCCHQQTQTLSSNLGLHGT